MDPIVAVINAFLLAFMLYFIIKLAVNNALFEYDRQREER